MNWQLEISITVIHKVHILQQHIFGLSFSWCYGIAFMKLVRLHSNKQETYTSKLSQSHVFIANTYQKTRN